MHTAVTTTDTKADAYRKVNLTERARQALAIEEIVRRHAPSQPDRALSGKEIQWHYERDHGKRIEAGVVSGRVNNLVTALRLVRIQTPRACSITGKPVLPVCLVQTQKPMFEGKQ